MPSSRRTVEIGPSELSFVRLLSDPLWFAEPPTRRADLCERSANPAGRRVGILPRRATVIRRCVDPFVHSVPAILRHDTVSIVHGSFSLGYVVIFEQQAKDFDDAIRNSVGTPAVSVLTPEKIVLTCATIVLTSS